MKLLNSEIFNAVSSLKELLNMDLPVRTSLSLAKLSAKLTDQFNVIEMVRNGLIRKYGKVNPKNPNEFKIDPESVDWPKFVDDLNELMAQSTETVFDEVKLPQEIDGKPLVIKPNLLISLQKFVDIEAVKIVKT